MFNFLRYFEDNLYSTITFYVSFDEDCDSRLLIEYSKLRKIELNVCFLIIIRNEEKLTSDIWNNWSIIEIIINALKLFGINDLKLNRNNIILAITDRIVRSMFNISLQIFPISIPRIETNRNNNHPLNNLIIQIEEEEEEEATADDSASNDLSPLSLPASSRIAKVKPASFRGRIIRPCWMQIYPPPGVTVSTALRSRDYDHGHERIYTETTKTWQRAGNVADDRPKEKERVLNSH